jgi:hypothetical protein
LGERAGKSPPVADEIAKPAARLDYTRAASNARKMPDWHDPRG